MINRQNLNIKKPSLFGKRGRQKMLSFNVVIQRYLFSSSYPNFRDKLLLPYGNY